jgi:hypothetical protein
MSAGAKTRDRTLDELVSDLEALLERVAQGRPKSARMATKVVAKLERLGVAVEEVAAKFDPILRPAGTFDPSDPKTAARMIALTLVAQNRYPLSRVPVFYGSGVYAIYYTGKARPYPAYSLLAGTDHPIYVGKAEPDDSNAKTGRQQGKALSKRLREHAARIEKVSSTLDVEDFECRFLGVQTGFQNTAEAFLIEFFAPIWNSDTNICFGMSKHGDAADTRGNGRSPWFTLHPGVRWADDPKLLDQKTAAQIHLDIASHLAKRRPYADIHAIFDNLVQSMRQIPLPLAAEPVPPEPD